MTLRDWCNLACVLPTHPTTEANMVSVLCRQDNPLRLRLLNLSDHEVVHAGRTVVWLRPRSRLGVLGRPR